MLYAIICLSLGVIPFVVWQGWGDGIRYPKEFYSIVAMLAIIGVSLANYHFKPLKNKWIFLFMGWCFLSTIVNLHIPVFLEKVVIDMPSLLFAWKELFYISLAVVTIWCIACARPKAETVFENGSVKVILNETSIKSRFNDICKVISIIVIILSVYGIVQAIGIDEFFRTADYGTGFKAQNPIFGLKGTIGAVSHRMVATIGNPSLFGVFVAFLLPLCLHLKNKLGFTAFALGVIIILLTKSAIAIGGSILGITIWLWFKNKKHSIIFLLISIMIGGAFLLTHPMFLNPTGRIEAHKEAFRILSEKAITGMGLGSFEYLVGMNPQIAAKLGNQNWKELHDEYGQIWFSVGLVGLSLFVMFIISSIRRFLRSITPESIALFASLMVFLAMSAGYFTFRVSPISFFGVVFTGLILNITGETE